MFSRLSPCAATVRTMSAGDGSGVGGSSASSSASQPRTPASPAASCVTTFSACAADRCEEDGGDEQCDAGADRDVATCDEP